MNLLLLLALQGDPVAEAMKKIEKAIAETPRLNLARAAEIVKLIENEGTFLESQKMVKEQAELYAKSAEALAKALGAERPTGPTRRAILVLNGAAKRAEKKKTDDGRVFAFRYAFARVQVAFQVECTEIKHLVSLGIDCFQAGQFEEAEEVLKEVEERLPSIMGKDLETTDKNARLAPLILAQTYLATGRFPEAGAAARRSIEIVPDLGDLEGLDLRKIHANGEDYDSQIRKLSEHVAKNPGDLDARFLHGYQLFFSAQQAKAKPVFEAVLEKNKDDKGAKYFLERLR